MQRQVRRRLSAVGNNVTKLSCTRARLNVSHTLGEITMLPEFRRYLDAYDTWVQIAQHHAQLSATGSSNDEDGTRRARRAMQLKTAYDNYMVAKDGIAKRHATIAAPLK